ncbi:hypothetical protein GGF45_001858 [Coemansia sp. RSA 551]|nr:hypothetical protein LPJ67_004178 [Coemansia sp. RSA 1938]KAJ2180703.1 hypothetical protein GGF45_001858 [Coemansia sp. RSA 551]KAJ2444183.1 hypothetical protein IWW46_002152 [Coemansia sp. RSA 2440]KAJ2838280.1 hypothetical protein J3B01_001510 [Coemansia erecta]
MASTAPDVFGKHKENTMHWDQGTVYDISWSSDGSQLTAAGSTGPVRTWRLERGGHKEGDAHSGLPSSIERIAWSPPVNPSLLAAAAYEKTVCVWDQRLSSTTMRFATKGVNSDVEWHPRGTHVLVASRDEGMEVFDTAQPNRPVVSASIDGASLNSARWNADGTLLLLATHAGSVEIYAWPTMTHITTIPAHASSCNCIASDPHYIATGGADSVQLYSTRDFSLLTVIGGFESPVVFAEFSACGKFVACASDDEHLVIHNTKGRVVHKEKMHGLTTALEWHPRNLAFAVASAAGKSSKPSVSIFL